VANKISKNIEKTTEVTILSAMSVVMTWLVNKYIVDVPANVSTAMVVVLTGVMAGVYNALTHGPIAWPWTMKQKKEVK
jgi:hypothetical protein